MSAVKIYRVEDNYGTGMNQAQMLMVAEQKPTTKFSHVTFTKDETIEFPNTSTVRFDDGYEVHLVDFFSPRKGSGWIQNWSVVT